MLISLLLFGTLVHAQTTVQGKVVDGNGLPIPGANVLLVGLAQGTVSDFDGNFTFNTNQQPPFEGYPMAVGHAQQGTQKTPKTLGFKKASEGSAGEPVSVADLRGQQRSYELPYTRVGWRLGMGRVRRCSYQDHRETA